MPCLQIEKDKAITQEHAFRIALNCDLEKTDKNCSMSFKEFHEDFVEMLGQINKIDS